MPMKGFTREDVESLESLENDFMFSGSGTGDEEEPHQAASNGADGNDSPDKMSKSARKRKKRKEKEKEKGKESKAKPATSRKSKRNANMEMVSDQFFDAVDQEYEDADGANGGYGFCSKCILILVIVLLGTALGLYARHKFETMDVNLEAYSEMSAEPEWDDGQLEESRSTYEEEDSHLWGYEVTTDQPETSSSVYYEQTEDVRSEDVDESAQESNMFTPNDMSSSNSFYEDELPQESFSSPPTHQEEFNYAATEPEYEVRTTPPTDENMYTESFNFEDPVPPPEDLEANKVDPSTSNQDTRGDIPAEEEQHVYHTYYSTVDNQDQDQDPNLNPNPDSVAHRQVEEEKSQPQESTENAQLITEGLSNLEQTNYPASHDTIAIPAEESPESCQANPDPSDPNQAVCEGTKIREEHEEVVISDDEEIYFW